VRKLLQQVPVHDRYYAMFVGYLSDEKYDEAGDNSIENMVFPPVSLNEMFLDRVKLKKLIVSKHFQKDGQYQRVEGPYTDKGHYIVFTQIKNAEKLLEQESWVVPLTPDEEGEKRVVQIERLAEDYENEYIKSWDDFFDDIEVKKPTTIDEAVELWGELKTLEYPYRRLLIKLRDNTQWDLSNPLQGRSALTNQLNSSMQNTINNISGFTIAVDINDITKREARVPGKFKDAVRFADAPNETDVYHYAEILTALINKVNGMRQQNAQLDLAGINQQMADARNQAETLLSTYDQDAKRIVRPLLVDPLTGASRENNVPKVTDAPAPGDAPPGKDKPGGPLGGWKMPPLPPRR